jgi:dihydropteroate synthase
MSKIVGVLNITPDSFSDGGEFLVKETALGQCKKMLSEGADVIDVGAESTRPNAVAISAEEEWRRVGEILPEIIDMAHQGKKEVSFDSRHFSNMQKALALGVDIINDVSGFIDKEMCQLATQYDCKIILMHNLGIPACTQKVVAKNLNVVAEVKNWAVAKIKNLTEEFSIKRENIIFDVGIGFGKDAEQSLEIIERINEFVDLGAIYVGHSRKSFLKLLGAESIEERDMQTAQISRQLAKQKIAYLRVHNVFVNVDAITKESHE